MNNEEKILALLEEMRTDITELKSGQEAMSDRLDRLESDVAGIKLRLENEVIQRFNLLAEGQQTLLETLAPKSRVEELAEDQRLLKHVVALHSRDIAELKKAE